MSTNLAIVINGKPYIPVDEVITSYNSARINKRLEDHGGFIQILKSVDRRAPAIAVVTVMVPEDKLEEYIKSKAQVPKEPSFAEEAWTRLKQKLGL